MRSTRDEGSIAACVDCHCNGSVDRGATFEMSTPNKYAPETNVMPPRCPHCGTDMPELATYQWNRQLASGLAIILSAYCPDSECRKLLHTQILIVPNAHEAGRI